MEKLLNWVFIAAAGAWITAALAVLVALKMYYQAQREHDRMENAFNSLVRALHKGNEDE